MTIRAAYEASKQKRIEIGTEGENRKNAQTRKNTSLDRKADEFIKKSPSAIRKMSARSIQYLFEDLQIQKIDLGIENTKLLRAKMALEDKLAKYSDFYDNCPVGYFSIDNSGIILEANIRGAKMLGVERGSLKGRFFSDFIATDDQDIFRLYRKELLETKAKQGCELQLVNKNGIQFYAHFECIVLLDEKGNLNQFRAVVSDRSEPMREEKGF